MLRRWIVVVTDEEGVEQRLGVLAASIFDAMDAVRAAMPGAVWKTYWYLT